MENSVGPEIGLMKCYFIYRYNIFLDRCCISEVLFKIRQQKHSDKKKSVLVTKQLQHFNSII